MKTMKTTVLYGHSDGSYYFKEWSPSDEPHDPAFAQCYMAVEIGDPKTVAEAWVKSCGLNDLCEAQPGVWHAVNW